MNFLIVKKISGYFEACDPQARKARLSKLAAGMKTKGDIKPSDIGGKAKRIAGIIRKFHPDVKKEAVDPEQRDKRIKRLKAAFYKTDKFGSRNNATKEQLSKYDAARDERDRLKDIINKYKIPGGVRYKDQAKVTFKKIGRFGNRKPKHGSAGWMRGYMHNPGAVMHVARKLASGKTKWYKGVSFRSGHPMVFDRKSDLP